MKERRANQKQFTLCWDCKKATTGECSWSKRLEPVNGWEAQETKNGFIVSKCPEFDRGSYGFGAYRTEKEYLEKMRKGR